MMKKRKFLFIAVALLIICMGTTMPGVSAAPVERSSHVLLQIPDIQGESTVEGYTKWIELSEVGFSSSIVVNTSGTGRGMGLPKEDDISVTRQVDTSSPAIFRKHLLTTTAGSGNNPYRDWAIVFLDDNGSPYLKYTLKEPVINSYKISNKARFAPEETFSVNYTGITVTTWDSRGVQQPVVSYDITTQRIN
ncbi:type VI secretion system tube protein Hcp [Paenibacillus sp. GCM10027628]|uniref:type VI secretion system tube protein Hcp n=1 Tax=Paenibacillus sp. GCM10027628 TaxID=3273413 RepID=UPI0036333537